MEIFLEKVMNVLSPSMFYSGMAFIIAYAFRESVISYISNLMSDYKVYSNRRVDDDGDPKSGQFCSVESKTNDSIHLVYYVEEYLWGKIAWIIPSNRRIKIWKFLENERKWVPTKLPYSVWGKYTVYAMPVVNTEMSVKLRKCLEALEEPEYLEINDIEYLEKNEMT